MVELQKVEIETVSGHRREVSTDVVVLEAKVLLKVNGRSFRFFHCLPIHLGEMVKGYLVSEGMCCPAQIKALEVKSERGGSIIEVTIQRHSTKLKEIKSAIKISVAHIWQAIQELDRQSNLYKGTGGTHIVGIFSRDNSIFVEDVSRHCAIDKAVGLALQHGIDLATCTLATSCRQTGTTIKKAIYSGIPVVMSVSAVTSLAIEMAKEYGITLIGFARGQRLNIYSHRYRIIKE